jgi:hypothetical protein
VVHAEVEIRELGHPHNPVRRTGNHHHLSLVTGHGGRSRRRGDNDQQKGEEPLAARFHGEGAGGQAGPPGPGAERDCDSGFVWSSRPTPQSPNPHLYVCSTGVEVRLRCPNLYSVGLFFFFFYNADGRPPYTANGNSSRSVLLNMHKRPSHYQVARFTGSCRR